jgi:hypothetical protein
MSNFRNFDRDTAFPLPPSVDDWLSEKHLARFVAEIIHAPDVSAMSKSYQGSGSASYHPKLLLAFWCTATPRVSFPAANGAGDLRFGGVPLHRRK